MNKIVFLMMFAILLVGTVSAAEWDNVKSYDPETRTATVTNALGLGAKIAEIQLKTPEILIVPRGYQQVAEFEVRSFVDYSNAFKELEFIDKKNGDNKILRNYDFKALSYEDYTVNEYESQCSLSLNGTSIVCEDVVIGSHVEQREKWTKLTPADFKKNDVLTIGIFTDVQKGDRVDWIPTFFGVQIEEWAEWHEGLNAGLIAYYNFEEGSGNTVGDIFGNYDMTSNSSEWVTGKLGSYGLNLSKSDSDRVRTTSNITAWTANYTINGWINVPFVGVTYQTIWKSGQNYNDADGRIHLLFSELDDISADKYIMNVPNTNNFASSISTITGSYAMMTQVYDANSNNLSLFVNGDAVGAVSISNDPYEGEFWLGFGADPGQGTYGNLQADEIGIWNRTLNTTEIDELYNGGAGLEFPGASVTLNSPVEAYNSTNQTVIFNITPSSINSLVNASIKIDGVVNDTNSSITSDIPVLFYVDYISEGTHNWSAEVCDSLGCTESGIRNFTIDFTNPTLTLNAPTGFLNYHQNNTELQLLWNTTDTSLSVCMYKYNGVNTSVTCGDNTTFVNIVDSWNKQIEFFVNDTFGNKNYSSTTWEYGVFENSRSNNATTFDTATENFTINVTANASLTDVSLVHNGSIYDTTQISDTWFSTIEIPLVEVEGNHSFYWNFTYAGNGFDGNTSEQTINATTFTECNSTYGDDYLNITFKDEETLALVNATVPTSTWTYYLGNGTINKTYTYSNTSQNFNYTFCGNADRKMNVFPEFQFKQGTAYPQRIWQPIVQTYTSALTNQTLYLLATADGLYVTFQVINSAEQALDSVAVNASRTISGSPTLINYGTTGSAGTVTFWLNPDFEHTFEFFKATYDVLTTSFFPTQSSYTITLGGDTTAIPNYYRGINYNVTPTNLTLFNDTSYDFDFVITSNYWEISEFGYNLTNSTGQSLSNQSATTNGGTVTDNIDTGDNTEIIMSYYWVINSTQINGTRTWYVINSELTDWSLKNAFDNLSTYITAGLFGSNSFTLALFVFAFIFIVTGVFSWKFGITSPAALSALVFMQVLFFDVGLGLMDSFAREGAVVSFPTIFIGIIMVSLLIREGLR